MERSNQTACFVTKDYDDSLLIFGAFSEEGAMQFSAERCVGEEVVDSFRFCSKKLEFEEAKRALIEFCKNGLEPIHLSSAIEDIEADK